MVRIPLEGKRFGLLMVLFYLGDNKYAVECDCGTIKMVRRSSLASRHTRSCGCLNRILCRERVLRHGMAGTPTYNIWSQMVQRCTDPRHKQWKDYGERGIGVCAKWLLFEGFYQDMGEKPQGLTIERKDNEGSYCKESCVWDTARKQANNRRSSRFEIYKNMRMTVADWARFLDVGYYWLYNRLRGNKTLAQIIEMLGKEELCT